MVALIEYWQSEEDGQWYFHLKAPYDGIIVQSVGYQSEEDCLIGIEQLKQYAELAVVSPQHMVSCS
ncbi:MAG: YegP family protein [Candidatus Thermoplasmatota archaeon]